LKEELAKAKKKEKEKKKTQKVAGRVHGCEGTITQGLSDVGVRGEGGQTQDSSSGARTPDKKKERTGSSIEESKFTTSQQNSTIGTPTEVQTRVGEAELKVSIGKKDDGGATRRKRTGHFFAKGEEITAVPRTAGGERVSER